MLRVSYIALARLSVFEEKESMRRHFSSISSILLGVSIWCLNFAFTHAAVENEPSTEEVTTQALTNLECLQNPSYCQVGTSDLSTWVSSLKAACFCCQGQAKIYSYIQQGYRQSCGACAVGTFMALIAHNFPSPTNCNIFSCPLNYNCFFCLAGKYQNSEGQSTCKSCAAGKFSAVGADVCQSCPAGKYNDFDGKSGCWNCAAGKYLATTGATSSSTCQDCAAGTFSETTGASSILACGN